MTQTVNNIIDLSIPWLLDHGVKVVLIAIAASIIHTISVTFVSKSVRRMIVSDKDAKNHDAEKKRENTLIRIFTATLQVLITLIALLMILSELGFAIGPLLATAGVAGLALGFGGQYLIRDLISGFFIIIENQYTIGDIICVGDTCGAVEDITLRLTTLRDLDGTVHHIPHGEVKVVSNLSKVFARVNMNIGVAYESNIEHVITVINRVGNELADDEYWKEFIIKAPQFLRVHDFADSAIMIKIVGDTMPLKQWDVAGELRKRLKVAFDNERIVIPFPQRVVHQGKS